MTEESVFGQNSPVKVGKASFIKRKEEAELKFAYDHIKIAEVTKDEKYSKLFDEDVQEMKEYKAIKKLNRNIKDQLSTIVSTCEDNHLTESYVQNTLEMDETCKYDKDKWMSENVASISRQYKKG